jgi:hypothetical protein
MNEGLFALAAALNNNHEYDTSPTKIEDLGIALGAKEWDDPKVSAAVFDAAKEDDITLSRGDDDLIDLNVNVA